MRKTAFQSLIPAVFLFSVTFCHRVLESGWPVFDGLRMAVINQKTVDHKELSAPLFILGKALNILLLLSGFYTSFYVANKTLRVSRSGNDNTY